MVQYDYAHPKAPGFILGKSFIVHLTHWAHKIWKNLGKWIYVNILDLKLGILMILLSNYRASPSYSVKPVAA